jgi:hypothetical protein
VKLIVVKPQSSPSFGALSSSQRRTRVGRILLRLLLLKDASTMD